MTYKDLLLPGTILILVCIIIGYNIRGERINNIVTTRIDSVPYPVPVPFPYKDTLNPIHTTRGTKDSIDRIIAEKNTIIRALQIKGSVIAINTIQPNGYTDKQEFAFNPDLPYIITADGTVTIDSTGLTRAKRKTFWRKAGNTAKDVGKVAVGIGIGYIIAK